jgi:hypothetical protein
MADIINIPLNDEEQALVVEAARSARLSVVQWCKVAMLKAARAPVVIGKPPHAKSEP